jgi:hypothetical protein
MLMGMPSRLPRLSLCRLLTMKASYFPNNCNPSALWFMGYPNFAPATHYSDLLRFMLIDARRRTFVTQRYCFIGSIDDWIDIGRSGTLAHLVTQHVQHLGKESYFNL